ncbi:hypothetical protein SAMN05421770_101622 [Granulicella rosea]|uniref:TPR repeat n=1 Tax=Granulicella rosea TaxID=474952 RepID=A0A239DSZ9_9BACT|nr:tetratricopeptide repeat protein [Granulicella rosea]SNS35261.1 hypothetical protein SAMN05421770_101622 [Granulicella rosea]
MTNQPDQNDVELVRDSAIRGVQQAQLLFGQMLLDGKVVERDPAAALHWFEQAAKSGDPMAMNMVGRCLDQGWGVARDAVLAAHWFRKAAVRGLDWGMYNLATLLSRGEDGVPQDNEQALYWLRRAAGMEHAKSINVLGGFYEDGWIVARDQQAAVAHYKRAAELGDFRGQFHYARVLAEAGHLAEAEVWVRKVPETATPAFLEKAAAFFLRAPLPEVQAFAKLLL